MAETYDRVSTPGLLRCCLGTIEDLYPDGPARVAEEGQILQCKHAPPDDRVHQMIFRDGTWKWNQPEDGNG